MDDAGRLSRSAARAGRTGPGGERRAGATRAASAGDAGSRLLELEEIREVDRAVRSEIAGLSVETSRSGSGSRWARGFSGWCASAGQKRPAAREVFAEICGSARRRARQFRSDAARGDSVSERALVLLSRANRGAGCAYMKNRQKSFTRRLHHRLSGARFRGRRRAPGRRSGARDRPLPRARRSLGRQRRPVRFRRSG